MSKIADDTYVLLKTTFPHNLIDKEHYVNFKGHKLYFDFYVKDLGILIECQGRQHDGYVQHFHGDRAGFIASKKRDNLKIEYCEKEKYVFVTINDGEQLTKEDLLDRVMNALLEKK